MAHAPESVLVYRRGIPTSKSACHRPLVAVDE